ncbi:hypothetical protein B0A54_17078 [Friedmanniomyces endolithicus]|uniref:Uncharacterized protein n=2 Tax=Friedmanniomyces endolithicus TaxID=329885 RepID=A0A4U0TTB1_9PEZI|nr:hypothetical protein LTS09_013824 [Friedmanniomyces endolithicus]TKA25491.1 hypothetical protein B0A54_17078 [Friedmanniomyces endolithicus]
MAIVFNTVLFSNLPFLEGIIIVFHCFGFLAMVVTLWLMGPRAPSWTHQHFLFRQWMGPRRAIVPSRHTLTPNYTRWSRFTCHLSEELHDAAYVLPRAMVATACATYVMGFVMVLTIMFTIGPDVQSVLNTPDKLTRGFDAFALVIGLLLTCCPINNVTTASRQLWSFARDGGIPFGAFFAKVRPGWDVPVNAMAFTWGITVILSLVIIGSPVAFSILTSLSLTGLISSYLLAVCCILAKRIRGEQFPPGQFNLGSFGFVANG